MCFKSYNEIDKICMNNKENMLETNILDVFLNINIRIPIKIDNQDTVSVYDNMRSCYYNTNTNTNKCTI